MKNTFSVYKLHFTSPLHLGDTRDDYSVSLKTVCSDTMYGALTSCLAKIGKLPDNFDGDLGFTISSLFPFYQKDENSEAVYFLPKPLRSTLPDKDKVGDRKKIKKVQWLDVDAFSKFIHGDSSIFEDTTHIHGEYLTSKEIDDDFISSQVSPRVVVPRNYAAEKDATPFYMDRIYFKGCSGLYFIMSGAVNLFNPAIELLQHEGIGTDRNVGNGFFTYSEDEIEIDCPSENDADYAVGLSMFIPKSEKQLKECLSGEKVGYDLVRRGGWITTPPFNTVRKSAIYAFTHGSVLSLQLDDDIQVEGKIEDLKPKWNNDASEPPMHPIYRNGKSFFIPIKPR